MAPPLSVALDVSFYCLLGKHLHIALEQDELLLFVSSSCFYNGSIQQPKEQTITNRQHHKRGQCKIFKNILYLLINRLQRSLYSPSTIPQTLQCSAHCLAVISLFCCFPNCLPSFLYVTDFLLITLQEKRKEKKLLN